MKDTVRRSLTPNGTTCSTNCTAPSTLATISRWALSLDTTSTSRPPLRSHWVSLGDADSRNSLLGPPTRRASFPQTVFIHFLGHLKRHVRGESIKRVRVRLREHSVVSFLDEKSHLSDQLHSLLGYIPKVMGSNYDYIHLRIHINLRQRNHTSHLLY